MEFQDFSLLVKDTKVSEFASGLERGVILATECEECGAVYYPPRHDCPRCFADQLPWVELEGEGRLLSFTSIFVPPKHFAPALFPIAPLSNYEYHPSPLGIVELENGVRVMGWIPGINLEALRVGMRLAPKAEVLPDGRATVVLIAVEA
jgi:uncharacterized OB-fold protein